MKYRFNEYELINSNSLFTSSYGTSQKMIGVHGAMNEVQLNTFLMAVPFHWQEACINGDMTKYSWI